MKKIAVFPLRLSFIMIFSIIGSPVFAQMITGVWKGKINRQKVEVKIIQNGDSLTGTSYYYESANNYRRYTIKGYFDDNTNSAVWWDDQLIEEKSGRFSISTPGKIPMLSRADFNCPGGGTMMLDGKVAKKENDTNPTGDVHLDKIDNPVFEDEWDFVIENYTVGTNDPDIIDSIGNLSQQPIVTEEPEKNVREEKPVVIPPTVIPEKTIDIHVDTVFYKAIWFWCLIALLLGTLLFGYWRNRKIHQYRVEKLQGKAQLLEKEKVGKCVRLHLKHTAKKLPQERQTWCFSDTQAWVVIERGPWRLGEKFMSELLRKHGWDRKP